MTMRSLSELQLNEIKEEKPRSFILPTHNNNQSSFGGFDPGSFAKGNYHQQTTALLENSCVTF